MISFIFAIARYLLALVLIAAAYLIYSFIVKQLWIRYQYKKYPNVYVTEKFVPVMGDASFLIQNIKEGKAYYNHDKVISDKLIKYDLRLVNYGNYNYFHVISVKAKLEMQELIPNKIDHVGEEIGISKMFANSIGTNRSTKDTINEKNAFIELLSLNSSSKHIPIMLE